MSKTTIKQKAEAILSEKTSKIIASNIKKNVTIFDVTGTYEGGNTHSVTLHPADYVAISLGQLAAAMDAQLSSTDKQKYLDTEGSGYFPAVVVAKGTYTHRNGSQVGVYDNAQIIITINAASIKAQVCTPDGHMMYSMCNIVQADSCFEYPYPMKVSDFISTFVNYHVLCPITLGNGGVSFEFQAPLSTMDIKGTNLSATIDTSNYNIFTTL